MVDLKSKPFEVMRTKEKMEEFRDGTAYWRSRLLSNKRKYTHIEFRSGYGLHRPHFRRRLLHVELASSVHRTYSNGLVVVGKNMIVLHLG